MTRVRGDGPLISPVWLAGLLTGDAQCQWASWFRAHHEDWERGPQFSVSRIDWPCDYTARLLSCIKRVEQEGYRVSNGAPNGYLLSVGGAMLSGRPDVIAVKGDDCVVIDFPEDHPKFGSDIDPTRSHETQVMIHMYTLPKPKLRWDVHLLEVGKLAGSLAGVPRPLIAAPSGSAVSPLLCRTTLPTVTAPCTGGRTGR